MNTLKQNKAIIRDFMRAQYTDAKLVELLDHARSGKLAYKSCCCFIGVTTATHELQVGIPDGDCGHYYTAARLPGALAAELSYAAIGANDNVRRRILIPMVLAEIRRRAKVSQPVEKREEVGA